ncbi:MAG: S41 family peptidase [Anaerolineae bacterium]
MTQREWTRTALIVVLLLVIVVASTSVGFAAGWHLRPQLGMAPSPAGDNRQYFDIQWQALDIIEREFNREGPLDWQALGRGATSGMVRALGDPYTTYVGPEEARIFEEDLAGSFGGIGASVDLVDGYLVIVEPMPDSPAARAGLRGGDVVLRVDGRDLEGLDLVQAIGLIRGPKGTQVTLLILREGVQEPFEVKVTREQIDLPTVETRQLDDDIAYLRLTEFNNQAATRLREALRQLLADSPRALIIDLRGNPGGYLHVSVQIASEFIRSGLVVAERDARGKVTEYKADGKGLAFEIPLVVLVDSGSASAAEILAGAIQDTGRGVLIGRQTFGKGSVQVSHTLSDGGSLRVSVARWYTPKGHQIDGSGLVPDVIVPPAEGQDPNRDVILERALAYIRDTVPSPAPETGP